MRSLAAQPVPSAPVATAYVAAPQPAQGYVACAVPHQTVHGVAQATAVPTATATTAPVAIAHTAAGYADQATPAVAYATPVTTAHVATALPVTRAAQATPVPAFGASQNAPFVGETAIPGESGMPQTASQARVELPGKRKSLLVGINYYGTDAELSGCVADVRRMMPFLEGFGFPSSEQCQMVLLDSPGWPRHRRPTLANMRNAIRWLTQDVQTGFPIACFRQAGHDRGCIFDHITGIEIWLGHSDCANAFVVNIDVV